MSGSECRYCGVDTYIIHEYYIISDCLWKQVNLDRLGRPVVGGMLCIGCVEKKLRRNLNRYDFPAIPVNHLKDEHKYKNIKSKRLINRLTRAE